MTVKVGSIQNQRPRFLSDEYEASVREDAKVGTEVVRVEAEDPDGERRGIRLANKEICSNVTFGKS